MTLETMLSELSQSEKLAAMDLLWRDLSSKPSVYVSPDWHAEVVAERLANPASGDHLSLNDGRNDVKERLHARRTEG